MSKMTRIVGVTFILLASGPAWANMPPRERIELTKPPTSQPASQPTTDKAPKNIEKAPGKAKGVALGLGATVLALGSGLYLARRRNP